MPSSFASPREVCGFFSWLPNTLSNKRAGRRLPEHRGPRPVRQRMMTRLELPYIRYMQKVCPTPMVWRENLSEKIRHLANHSRKMSEWARQAQDWSKRCSSYDMVMRPVSNAVRHRSPPRLRTGGQQQRARFLRRGDRDCARLPSRSAEARPAGGRMFKKCDSAPSALNRTQPRCARDRTQNLRTQNA
jgi:hypothetical protein